MLLQLVRMQGVKEEPGDAARFGSVARLSVPPAAKLTKAALQNFPALAEFVGEDPERQWRDPQGNLLPSEHANRLALLNSENLSKELRDRLIDTFGDNETVLLSTAYQPPLVFVEEIVAGGMFKRSQ